MTRKEFMRQLEQLLKDLPEHDRLDAIAYYEDYFDEAGPEKEVELILELGSPEKVAATLKRETKNWGSEQGEYTEYGYSDGCEERNRQTPAEQQEEKKNVRRPLPLALVIVILIFGLPIGGSLLSGVFGILLGVLGAVFGCLVALIVLAAAGLIGGSAVFVVGLTKLILDPALGLLGIGVGTLLLAIGLILLILFLWLVIIAIPAMFRFVVDLCQKGLYKLRGGNKNE